MNYEEYNKALFDSLLAEKVRIILNPNKRQNRSIFGIQDSKDEDYNTLLRRFEVLSIEWFEKIVLKLCNLYSLKYFTPSDKFTCDICIEKDGVVYDLSFRLYGPIGILRSQDKKAFNPYYLVLLIDSSEQSQDIIDHEREFIKKRTDRDIKVVNCLDFIELFFGSDEAKAFEQNTKIIKSEARDILGQRITDICTPTQKRLFKDNLEGILLNFNYEDVAEGCGFIEKIYLSDFQIIKDNFVNHDRLSILLGDKDFADSFFASEWLFQNYSEQDGLVDNTHAVVGYLKSVEQLLWSIVNIIGKGRRIGKKKIIIDGDKTIRTTLEDFCFFIDDPKNRNLCDSGFNINHASSLMSALHDCVDDYKNHCRNGYLHKDNVDFSEVCLIRKKTLLLYFLILGILKINDDEIAEIGGLK